MKQFETVAQMKLARLTAGQTVTTKGYYAAGDAGGATYLVAASQTVDGYGDHALANGNVALLQTTGDANIWSFGAVANDDTFDNLPVFSAAFSNIERGSVRATGLAGVEFTSFYSSGTVEVPQQINLIGDSRGGTRIIAMPGFTDSYVVRLGTSVDSVVTGTTCQFFTIDANSNAGVISGYSNSINENSGFRDCSLVAYNAKALLIAAENGGVPINFELYRLSLVMYDTDGTTYVGEINASHARAIEAITVVGDGFGGPAVAAIGLLLTGGLKAPTGGFHIEGCVSGLVIGDGAGGGIGGCQALTVNGVTGPSSGSGAVTSLVNIFNTGDNRNITLMGLDKRSATNVLLDGLTGLTLTDEGVAFLVIGEGATTGDRPRKSASASVQDIIYAQKQFGQKLEETVRETGTSYTIDHSKPFYEGRNNTITATIADTAIANREVIEITLVHTGSGATTIQPTGADVMLDSNGSVQASVLLTSNKVYKLFGMQVGASNQWMIVH